MISLSPLSLLPALASFGADDIALSLPLALAGMALWGFNRGRDEQAEVNQTEAARIGATNGAAGQSSEVAALHSSLHQMEGRYRVMWAQAREGFFECDADGHFRDANPALLQLLGYNQAADLLLAGRDFGRRLWVETERHDEFWRALQSGAVDEVEAQLRTRDGKTVWTQWTVRALRDDKEQLLGFCGSIADISREKTAEDRLMRHAFHDKITGLPDRSLFMERITQQLRRGARETNYRFAVLVLDLDRFKSVNDSLGHGAGDQLLSSTARKLEAVLRAGDFLARLGGDEFGIVLDETADVEIINQLADRIQKRLALPTTIGEQEVYSTVSIGVVFADRALIERETRSENLLRDAEAAMYRAKEKGRARHEIFEMVAKPAGGINAMQLESELRRAVERNEFAVYYQPIVSLATGRIIGFEALIRWFHPKRGTISPYHFIPIAEETGLILPIGHWMMRAACQQLAKWHARGGRDAALMMSINLSAKQFAQPDLVRQVDRILQSTGLDGGSVKLEITESAIMGNPESAISMLNQFKAYGIKLSLDDFGTGYSSLSYLHRFPFNVLKIDQSFVSAMDTADKNEEIVRTIVALAHTLRMDVIAEGVETEEQLEHLRALKCHYGQGYYFAGPLDAESATEMLTAAPQW